MFRPNSGSPSIDDLIRVADGDFQSVKSRSAFGRVNSAHGIFGRPMWRRDKLHGYYNVSLIGNLSNDTRIRHKHEKMAATGHRPPYLMEVYNSVRNLEKEANSLVRLGYRLQGQRIEVRRASTFYHATFGYVPEADTLRRI